MRQAACDYLVDGRRPVIGLKMTRITLKEQNSFRLLMQFWPNLLLALFACFFASATARWEPGELRYMKNICIDSSNKDTFRIKEMSGGPPFGNKKEVRERY